MEIFSHKTDSFLVSADHFRYKLTNVRLVVRKKPVSFKKTVKAGYGGVHKKKRNIQAAYHLTVAVIKHFKTYDTGGLFWIKGTWEFQIFNLIIQDAVHGKTIAKTGQLLLKCVHNGGDKVRLPPKNAGKKSNLPCSGGI